LSFVIANKPDKWGNYILKQPHDVIANLPTISNSWAVLKNYLRAALITKMRLLQISVSQTVGKVHDTFVIGAMSQTEGMPHFMNYLLGGSFQK
jgi:hypothetical protein